MLTSNDGYSQYSISGYLNSPQKNKRVYLSLLRYDEQNAVGKEQLLTSTLADSTGYFSFSGKLLSNQSKLYRVHANIDENSPGLDFADTDEIKNFHNFIFSNTDTIVFIKSEKQWFTATANTNTVDKQWREIRSYKQQLRQEFSGTRNKEARIQFSSQFLAELKTYVSKTKTHPLVKLILLYGISENILERDFEKDAEFYLALKSELKNYYSNKSYALQYEDLISNVSISKTQQELTFYKRMTYLLSFVVLALTCCVFFLFVQVRRKQKYSENETINLTNQEEKVAKLIIQEKSNKEIASELFISLSTVKTHIRNLYAKYEVSNRQQFTAKMKNHPRD